MTLSRRGFIFGLGATLAVVRTPGLLMAIRPLGMEFNLPRMMTLEDYSRMVLRPALENLADRIAYDKIFIPYSSVDKARKILLGT